MTKFVVVRGRDDINVDLMSMACGHDYGSSDGLISPVLAEGVTIPFASPIPHWKTKNTYRQKDPIDRLSLNSPSNNKVSVAVEVNEKSPPEGRASLDLPVGGAGVSSGFD